MDPDRWRLVEQICHDALAREPGARGAFLAERCAGDTALRREVESLLAQQADAGGFLESRSRPPVGMGLSPGARLGPFEILELVGAGGMGEVYKARDTRLGRTVAIKVLPPGPGSDPERRRRFEHEARAVSALNHPHICTLHDIGSSAAQAPGAPPIDYLVMEFLEGQTLAERLRSGPLPLARALEYGGQIADALGRAHRQGVVHRDLKPANIMLTAGGAKLLDFGLAKLKAAPAGHVLSPASALATMEPTTTPGTVLGTVPYMSPEQLEGKDADARTDLFAFGCVLYEMLTGQRAFAGDSGASVISAIMTSEPPPVSSLQPVTPPAIDRLVARCLAKDADERWQTAQDLADQLRWIARSATEPSRPPAAGSGSAGSAPASADRRVPTHGRPLVHLRPRVALVGGAAVLAIAGALLAAYRFIGVAPPLSERDSILIADFDNRTGDGVFDETLRQALTVQLQQSPFLTIVSGERVATTLRLMGRQPGERLTRTVAREVCQREGAKAMLAGSVAPLGGTFVVTLEGVNCVTGDLLATVQGEARGKEVILATLADTSRTLRARLGEALPSIQKYDVPVRQAATASLEALKLFSSGMAARDRGDDAAALPLFARAVEIDPEFALAWAHLSASLRIAGRAAEAERAMARAFERRDRVPEQERYYITHRYYTMHGELYKAIENNRAWASVYPRNWMPHDNLCKQYWQVGDTERALPECREAVRLEPDSVYVYDGLIGFSIALGRLDEARMQAGVLLKKGINDSLAHLHLARIAWLQADSANLEQELTWLQANARSEYTELRADMAIAAGRLREAEAIAPGAVGLDGLAFVGRIDEARKRAVAALERWVAQPPPALPNPSVGVAAALAGEAAWNERVFDAVAARAPHNVWANQVAVPTVRAALELSRGNGSKAVELLEPARPFGFGEMRFMPVYLRGLGFLQAKRPREAAAEFEQIIAHRGVNPGSVLWPLAHLGRARAHALAGDTAASRRAYERFLALWADADEDLPVLQEAKREYASLR